MSGNDLIDLTVFLHAETELAILVSEDGEDTEEIWVPKSNCEFYVVKGNIIELTLPEWLAIKKGLI